MGRMAPYSTRISYFARTNARELRPGDNSITYFARTNARRPYKTFGIKREDRFSHLYLIGKTGTGKTTLLETLIRQDIAVGRALALVDPHGDLVERVAKAIPSDRKDDLIYFNAPDSAQPYGYNPLKRVHSERRTLAASGMLEVFKKMWSDAWGVRMEHVLRNALLALLEQPAATMLDIPRILVDGQFRKTVAEALGNEPVKRFWLHEYPAYSFRYRADTIAPVQNKVGAFLAHPTIRRILTRPERPIQIRRSMDEGRILLVNLAKGKIGEDASGLLGGLLVTTIGLAAYSRADTPEEERRDFYVYIDEFQNFTTLSVANMIAELRKYRLGLTLAHQYLHQLEPDVRHAVLGNAGTIISFRLGPKDAAVMAREFEPAFKTVDLLNLENYNIYLRLMIDGMPSKPFSATTLRPEQARVRFWC